MKHLLKLSLLLLAFHLPTITFAHDFVVGGIYYNVNGDEAIVTYRGTSSWQNTDRYKGNVTIPSTVTYNGMTYSVTAIGNAAFEDCRSLTSVTIPNSIASIGSYAFYGCTGLTNVHISDLEAWCNISFSRYYSNPLIYSHTLYFNGEEVTDLVIPNSVTSISSSAFNGYTGLTSVTIPNSVTSIGSSAFSGCSGLSSVIIPSSITSIGNEAFYNCSALTSVNITDLEAWLSISFYNNSANPLFYANHLFLNGEEIKDLIIPNSVTSIDSYAFYGCSGMTSVTIPTSVISIGYGAFYECSGLKSVTFSNSVTTIGGEAFFGCSGLTSVTIPNSVVSIGYQTFFGCNSLRSVTIGSSVTSIGKYAFWDCTALDTLNFIAISCNDFDFSNADGQPFHSISIINIGDNVQRIPAYFAVSLKELKNIIIPNSVRTIGKYAFWGCI